MSFKTIKKFLIKVKSMPLHPNKKCLFDHTFSFGDQKGFMLGGWLKRDFSVNLCPFFKDQNVHTKSLTKAFFPFGKPKTLRKISKNLCWTFKMSGTLLKMLAIPHKMMAAVEDQGLPCSNGFHVVRRRYCWRSRQFSS